MCFLFVCVLHLSSSSFAFPSRLSPFGYPENIVNWQKAFPLLVLIKQLMNKKIPNQLFRTLLPQYNKR